MTLRGFPGGQPAYICTIAPQSTVDKSSQICYSLVTNFSSSTHRTRDVGHKNTAEVGRQQHPLKLHVQAKCIVCHWMNHYYAHTNRFLQSTQTTSQMC